MVAAIIRDGELSLQNEMGEWRPPTNPTLERLVKETELTWLAAGKSLLYHPVSIMFTHSATFYPHRQRWRSAW